MLPVSAFWRGLGPALVLVINPIIQYTAFEQLKNSLIARRTRKLRAAGAAVAVAVLSDLDFFFLGALSKLSKPAESEYLPKFSCLTFFFWSRYKHHISIHVCFLFLLYFFYDQAERLWEQCCKKQAASRGFKIQIIS